MPQHGGFTVMAISPTQRKTQRWRRRTNLQVSSRAENQLRKGASTGELIDLTVDTCPTAFNDQNNILNL
jgi:hypothetical protein